MFLTKCYKAYTTPDRLTHINYVTKCLPSLKSLWTRHFQPSCYFFLQRLRKKSNSLPTLTKKYQWSVCDLHSPYTLLSLVSLKATKLAFVCCFWWTWDLCINEMHNKSVQFKSLLYPNTQQFHNKGKKEANLEKFASSTYACTHLHFKMIPFL